MTDAPTLVPEREGEPSPHDTLSTESNSSFIDDQQIVESERRYALLDGDWQRARALSKDLEEFRRAVDAFDVDTVNAISSALDLCAQAAGATDLDEWTERALQALRIDPRDFRAAPRTIPSLVHQALTRRGVPVGEAPIENAVILLDRVPDGSAVRRPAVLDGPLLRAAFVPDASGRARTLATAGSDRRIRLWNVETRTEVGELVGHRWPVTDLAITKNSGIALSASWDKTVRVWDINWRRCLRTLSGHTGGVTSCSVDANGVRAASGSWDGTARVWDLRTGACVHVLRDHDDHVTDVQMSADGERLVSVTARGIVRYWHATTGRLLLKIKAHVAAVHRVALSECGKFIATAGQDKTCRLFSTVDGEIVHTFLGHDRAVLDVVFGTCPSTLLTVSRDRTLRQWSTETGDPLGSLKLGDIAESVSIAPDRDIAVTTGKNGLTIWDLETGLCRQADSSPAPRVTSIAHSPAAGVAAVATGHGELRLERVDGSRLDVERKSIPVTTCRFIDDDWFVVGDARGRVEVRDAKAGNERFSAQVHVGPVSSIEIAGSELVVFSSRGAVSAIDPVNGEARPVVELTESPVVTTGVFPGEKVVYVGDDQGGIVSIALDSGATLRTPLFRSSFHSLELAEHSGTKWLLGASSRSVVAIDPSTLEPVEQIHLDDNVVAARATQTGAVVALDSGRILFLDASLDRVGESYLVDGAEPRGLRANESGTLVAVTDWDDAVTVFETATLEVAAIAREAGGFSAVEFAAERLLCGDSTGRLWSFRTN